MLFLLLRVLGDLSPGAIWIVIFLVVFYTAVIAVFVRHAGAVLRELLNERDPERQRILQQVLRDLLGLFRRGERR